jgi:hypothetical protein
MKQLIFMLCSVISFGTYAQTVYLADTAFITDVGYGGAPASCKTNDCVYNAVEMDRSHSIWVADVFTVPPGATWVFDTVVFFGYQYASGLSSPFRSCNLQIYNGAPGLGGTVIWGDTVTNLLVNSDFTGIYKVDTFSSDNGLLSTERPIMNLKLYLPAAPRLTAGAYWLSWSAAGISTSNPANSPYKVLPGRVNPPGQMGRQFIDGEWYYVTDNSNSTGFDMMIEASAGLAAVPAINNNPENVLGQNTPNPFGNTTEISYYLQEPSYTNLSVFNMLGQKIATLVDGSNDAGNHQLLFHADNLAGGLYYYKLATTYGLETKQMILVK